MAKSEKNKPPVNIEAFKYKDRRANIPTEELRDFVVKEEASPKTILYPRDPSLDPQLVWKGKDEQGCHRPGSAVSARLYPGEDSPQAYHRRPPCPGKQRQASPA